jgi:hypothetical protein
MAASPLYCGLQSGQYGQNWATSPSRRCTHGVHGCQKRHGGKGRSTAAQTFAAAEMFRMGKSASAKEEEKSDRENSQQRKQYDRQQKGHPHFITTFD